jgi:hypothetical protein
VAVLEFAIVREDRIKNRSPISNSSIIIYKEFTLRGYLWLTSLWEVTASLSLSLANAL